MKKAETDPKLEKVLKLVNRIRPILAGTGSMVQGAVVAELAATWIACHQAETEKAKAAVHAALLDVLNQTITNLLKLKN
jgi:hypothetical protein